MSEAGVGVAVEKTRRVSDRRESAEREKPSTYLKFSNS